MNTSLPSEPVGMRDICPTRVLMITRDRAIDRRILDEARSLVMRQFAVTILANTLRAETAISDEDLYPEITIKRIDPEKQLGELNEIDHGRLDLVLDQYPQWPWDKFFSEHRYFFREALLDPAGIVVAHDLPTLPLAAIVAAYHGSFLVYDSHELYPFRALGDAQDVLPRSTWVEMEEYLTPLCDHVLTVSKSFSEELSRRYKIEHPSVVNNSPRLGAHASPLPRSNLLRESLQIPMNQRRILLYQGYMSDNSKNLDLLITAMGKIECKDVALVLMGADNGTGAVHRLRLLAMDNQLLDTRVYFQPAVPQSELLRYTASADAGIIPYPPSTKNMRLCSPNKLFEYLVAGIPILANNSPELNRFVAAQGTGMNHPLQTEQDFVDAINHFLSVDHKPYRNRLAEIASSFSWEAQEHRLVEIFESLRFKPSRREALMGGEAL